VNDSKRNKYTVNLLNTYSSHLKKIGFFTLILLTSVLIAACSSDKNDEPEPEASNEPVYTVITEGTLNPGDEIPVPDGDPVLTVTGLVENTNQDDAILMDLAAIESVGEVEYTVMDPFEDISVTYQGVLLNDLLALWGADENAETLSVLALNDYQVDIPLAELRQYPIIFALKRNGEYMPVSTRGPAMLVFPYDDFEFEQTVFNDYWVWQIKSIEVH
jgi:hypothetical protein